AQRGRQALPLATGIHGDVTGVSTVRLVVPQGLKSLLREVEGGSRLVTAPGIQEDGCLENPRAHEVRLQDQRLMEHPERLIRSLQTDVMGGELEPGTRVERRQADRLLVEREGPRGGGRVLEQAGGGPGLQTRQVKREAVVDRLETPGLEKIEGGARVSIRRER